ncbi:hypothetical protein J7E62_29770 [Variovorax paradoxus]|nr:hypothetical protein [Variovorax paradoxus]
MGPTTVPIGILLAIVCSAAFGEEADVLLPGHTQVQSIKYQAWKGRAIFEGDIDLGPIELLPFLGRPGQVVASGSSSATGTQGRIQQPLFSQTAEYLWPGGIVYYFKHKSVRDNTMLNTFVEDALKDWRELTNVRWEERTTQKDYVRFELDNDIPGNGQSKLGRQGGRQWIKLRGSASKATVIHEMGHAAGLYHEHTRSDRDDFVKILWENIRPGVENNYEKRLGGVLVTPYDYTSRMHYTAKQNGEIDLATGEAKVTIQSLTSVAVNPSDTLSPRDIEGINKLYPRNDCGPMPVLFQNTNKGGSSLPVEYDQPNLASKGFGDKASSICVPMGWTVHLYRGSGYGGSPLTIEGPQEVLDLGQRGWNDTISSLRLDGASANPAPIACTSDPDETDGTSNDFGPTLFQDAQYEGRRVHVLRSIARLADMDMNDRVSSVCVPAGWTLTLHKGHGFTGRSLRIVGDMRLPDLHRLADGWNDSISSVEVTKGTTDMPVDLPRDCTSSPVFFFDDNFRGYQLKVTADVRNLHQLIVNPNHPKPLQRSLSDAISSVCVPDSWSVTVFADVDFSGSSVRLSAGRYTDLSRDGPGGQDWGDRISSIRISRRPAGTTEVSCSDGTVLFERDGYMGQQFSVVRDFRNLHNYGFGDKASSICIKPNTRIEVYENVEYRGERRVFPASPAGTPNSAINLHRIDWGDRISSICVDDCEVQESMVFCGEPVAFTDAYFKSRQIRLASLSDSTKSDLHRAGYGDRISSICVPGGNKVTLFEHTDHAGDPLVIEGPKVHENLSDNGWNDRASSLTVEP